MLHVKHQCHLNKRKKIRNTLFELSIDDDCEMLKKMCCLSIGKSIDFVLDSNCMRVKVLKSIEKQLKCVLTCLGKRQSNAIKVEIRTLSTY